MRIAKLNWSLTEDSIFYKPKYLKYDLISSAIIKTHIHHRYIHSDACGSCFRSRTRNCDDDCYIMPFETQDILVKDKGYHVKLSSSYNNCDLRAYYLDCGMDDDKTNNIMKELGGKYDPTKVRWFYISQFPLKRFDKWKICGIVNISDM